MSNQQTKKELMEVSFAEKNLLLFCRKNKFGEIKIIFQNGEPTKGEEVKKSIRFDLGID